MTTTTKTPDWQAAEFRWYRRHGRYVDRCRIDITGKPYVIGDRDWNKRNPDRREHIERAMHNAIGRNL